MSENKNPAVAGQVERRVSRPCPDCGVLPGEQHQDWCDVERCPDCGGQLISCGCEGDFTAPRLPWTGEWPGVMGCREFGWYAKLVAGKGWIACDKDDTEAREDLNRLYRGEAVWSKEQGRWNMRANAGHERTDKSYAFAARSMNQLGDEITTRIAMGYPQALPEKPQGWTKQLLMHMNFCKDGCAASYEISDPDGNKAPFGYQYDTRKGGLTGFTLPGVEGVLTWAQLRAKWPEWVAGQSANDQGNGPRQAQLAEGPR